jgi:hypothetical protein
MATRFPERDSESEYDRGFRLGYEAFNAGSDSEFYDGFNAGTAVVLQRRPVGAPKTVEPDGLEYARGYIDGFMRAEGDSHD